MVKTLPFHCRGMGSIPGWGTEIPHTMWYDKKKKRKHKIQRVLVFFLYTQSGVGITTI